MADTLSSDDAVSRALSALVTNYQGLIHNETIHRELSRSTLTPAQWRDMDALVDVASHTKERINDLYTIYQGISSFLAFVRVLATETRPALRAKVTQARHRGGAPNSLLEMTASILEDNSRLLLDRIGDLYAAATHLDEQAHGGEHKVGRTFRELNDPATWAIGF